MADIFISYKSAERTRVDRIARALEAEGYSVWWDYSLRGGEDYSEVIETQIASAKIVMPIWSRESVRSQWVRAETERGRGKLFPVRIEEVEPPLPYNKLHTLDLVGWSGDINDPAWRRFSADLRSVINGEPRADMPVAGKARFKAWTLLAWVGAPAVALALVFALMPILRDRTPAQPTNAEEAGGASAAEPGAETAAQTPATRDIIVRRTEPAQTITTYSDAMAALTSNGSPLSLEICRTNAPVGCGISSLHVGDVITVRITSPIAGQLVLIDQNADGRQTQIVPNGLSAAGASFAVRAGQASELPTPALGFEFAVGEPIGRSSLIAVVLPSQSALPTVVQENRQSRDIRVIPRARRDDWAPSVSEALSGSGGVALGRVDYEIVP